MSEGVQRREGPEALKLVEADHGHKPGRQRRRFARLGKACIGDARMEGWMDGTWMWMWMDGRCTACGGGLWISD